MSLTTAVVTGGPSTGVTLPNALLTVYSREILFNALPLLRFEQFVVRKDELGVLPGLTISMMKYDSLTGSYVLTEGTDMVTAALSSSAVTITVGERGKATAVSDLLLRTSYDDVLSEAARLLGMHLAKNRDAEIRDILYTVPSVLYAKGRTARTAITATDTFDVDLIRDAVEALSIAKAPKVNADALATSATRKAA